MPRSGDSLNVALKLVITQQERDYIERLAEQERASMSSIVRRILRDRMADDGAELPTARRRPDEASSTDRQSAHTRSTATRVRVRKAA